jgi:U5 small nuclear ribonucleoprotein component
MDMFVEQTHRIENALTNADKPMRYTDTRVDEQEREMSLKMVPMSLALESSSTKCYLFNLIDTPGTSSRRCIMEPQKSL